MSGSTGEARMAGQRRLSWRRSTVKAPNRSFLAALAGFLVIAAPAGAQTGRPVPARAAAPADLTGYWVSVVTTLDWRFRMVVPPKGDYFGIRMTPAGLKLADTWDPAHDEAAGEQCKSYGAAGIMRIPGRLHIAWSDDNTLRVDADAGTQTRLVHFGERAAPSA